MAVLASRVRTGGARLEVIARLATSLRHSVEYAALVSVAAVVRVVPRGVLRWCGGALGLAFYVVDGSHRRLTVANLHTAFPLRSRRECRALARATFAHFGRLAVDLLKFRTLSPDHMMTLVDFTGGEHVEQAHAQGRGLILMTGHFGFWELQALAHALKFQPMSVVARALDNPRVNAFLEEIRGTTGNAVIYRRRALRRVLRELSENRAVGMLIDQHIHSTDAVYVDFFNRPAATTSALAALAARTGAPVVPLFALPLPDGRYRMIYEHAVEPPVDASPESLKAFTQRCTDVLEMYVRRYPNLWLWMHRRWRGLTPALEHTGGMFPAAKPDDAENDVEDESRPVADEQRLTTDDQRPTTND